MISTRTVILTAVIGAAAWSASAVGRAQDQPARREPQVRMVHTVGCVERREAEPASWWLTGAAEPTDTRPGVFNRAQIAEIVESAAPGSREFQLIGVADFLDAEGLLATADRALFTTPDQVNATGELRPGRIVLVKGLLIEADDVTRINLTAVVGLADMCGR